MKTRSKAGRSGDAKGSGTRHYARHRPGHKDTPSDKMYIYGLHSVRHALANPNRKNIALYTTRNALDRLNISPEMAENLKVEECQPRQLDSLVGRDAVHQGVILETAPLATRSLDELQNCNLVLVLDQITDPHNVGAILRSAVAFGAGAVIVTARYSPAQTGVLAKAASGALDIIDLIEVRNLANCLKHLNDLGFTTIGLDSDGPETLEASASGDRIALVLGAEGKGLRQKTGETCNILARIDMPGAIGSLNVSNAAVLALYIARNALHK
jgi:23S rRNA (guanosine2251-2'-O)-methyltransferase